MRYHPVRILFEDTVVMETFMANKKPNFTSFKGFSSKPAAKKAKVSQSKKIAAGKEAAKLAAKAEKVRSRGYGW